MPRGLVTERVLRSHRYRRLFHDIYYLAANAPADLAPRSQGATLFASVHGVLSGYSAAELLGARCAPAAACHELDGTDIVRAKNVDGVEFTAD